ncbi:hypothetical protein [Thalassospira mesophila]|uniref:hypothetical protein n=1 Tax=Thalassospira mesophila TaxID=1293891 RepID=UPI00130224EB|nr:hypothetical protein [Thalassospira mesophila]
MTERKVSHAQQMIAFITGLSIFGPAEFIKSAFIIATMLSMPGDDDKRGLIRFPF